jgi:hypothetical protein
LYTLRLVGRWYHHFSALTATAGGFDLKCNVLTGHGPLGGFYPTNTGLPQKEGDTPTFLYIVPTGMNNSEGPTWGSWAGRYGLQEDARGKPYYWADVKDVWQGTAHPNNTLKRRAAHLQNDFRASLDWCVKDFAGANHPPAPKAREPLQRNVAPGEEVILDASGSTDPDEHKLKFEWLYYAEPGTYQGPRPRSRAPKRHRCPSSRPR